MAESPYGFWTSPVTSDFVVADSIRLEQVALDGDVLYWSEAQPQKKGRSFVYRIAGSGEPEPITPDDDNDYSVRTRVHEYGGGSFAVSDGVVYFSNDVDQRAAPKSSFSPLFDHLTLGLLILLPANRARRDALLPTQPRHRVGRLNDIYSGRSKGLLSVSTVLDMIERGRDNFLARPSGSLSLRFIVQPTMAALLALRSGVQGAKEGKQGYLWAVASNPERRFELLHEGWRGARTPFLAGIALDSIYQIITVRFVYPLELLFTATLLALVPYALLRGPFNRLARLFLPASSRPQ